MKSAAQWFAELPAPPDPGLVDQQYRVVTLEQIAAISWRFARQSFIRGHTKFSTWLYRTPAASSNGL